MRFSGLNITASTSRCYLIEILLTLYPALNTRISSRGDRYYLMNADFDLAWTLGFSPSCFFSQCSIPPRKPQPNPRNRWVKTKIKNNKTSARGVQFAFLAVLCLVTLFPSECFADGGPLTKTGALQETYAFTFYLYDECGDYTIGERMREALVAKLESCPFTEEAKLSFYKNIALSGSKAVSGVFSILYAHQFKFVPPENTHCDSPERQKQVQFLQERFAKYDAGQVALADVLVNFKDPGEPVSCTEIAKNGTADVGARTGIAGVGKSAGSQK